MDAKDLVKKGQANVESTRNIRKATPLVDIYENDDEILMHVEIPGVKKEDINVNIDNGSLTVTGLRMIKREGAADWEEFGDVEFQRAFSVPQTIDVNKVQAELQDGILALHLPKSEAAKPRMIEIKVG